MKSIKRVLALVAAIALLGIILVICVLLFSAKSYSDNILRGLISCLIAIPLVAYGYLLLCRYTKNLSKSLNEAIEDETQE
ncbi:MAG: hypothetical protein E7262_04070 [Lachnospiraceae bacterium]|nr:hypothetical protein [Lachnospiraceae bacterium]